MAVAKTDVETDSTLQGVASLAGAGYGIYKDKELIDTYITMKTVSSWPSIMYTGMTYLYVKSVESEWKRYSCDWWWTRAGWGNTRKEKYRPWEIIGFAYLFYVICGSIMSEDYKCCR